MTCPEISAANFWVPDFVSNSEYSAQVNLFMYCPQCSQEQLSDEMRFCNRCGLPLTGVRDLIAAGGSLPAQDDAHHAGRLRSMKGARRAAWTMLLSFAWTVFVLFLTALDEDLAMLLFFSAAGFLVGFLFLFYAVFVQGRRAREYQLEQIPPALIAEHRNPQLPPQRAVPIDTFTRPIRNTAEVAQPPSVTENTTRLLEDDIDSNRA